MELEIYKTLVLSTEHLTMDTLRYLENLTAEGNQNNFISRDYSYLVICRSSWFDKREEEAREEFFQLPADLQYVLTEAKSLGITAVEFDQDGALYDRFPNYEHE
ncbi:hypothetical protein ACK36G_18585 [Aeromonas veronii]|uniref:DUF5983 family protein n=1 Tax=Aeromonas caviae TaxID=648 RepID=UPI002E7B8D1E|nr:hypothetical protein [Aeromonas caviae]MEE1913637.1 hypothetical protein [Aeromonas caviae]